MSRNILSVFEKHIGKQQNIEIANTRIIKNIKDTNSIIGALQTIDIALKKCLSCLNQPDLMKEITENCSFMGEALFGMQISIPMIQRDFYIERLQEILACNSIEETQDFILDKREEIKNLLQCIFESLSQQDSNDSLISPARQISLEKFF